MKKIASLILLIIGLNIQAKAQEQLDTKQLADNLFERYEYFKALTIYLKLAGRGNPKISAIERVADCYRLMNDYDNAEIWYRKAVSYPDASPIDAYYYAEILLRNKKFNDARDEYKQYYASADTGNQLEFKLAVCDSAEKWIKSLINTYIVKNEQKFNSKYSDWGMNYYGKTGFVFTSDRKVSDKKKDIYYRNGDGYFNLYRADGDLTVLFPLKVKDNPLFKDSYHVGPMTLNAAEDTAYITISTTLPRHRLAVDKDKKSTERLYTRRLLLIVATKTNNEWNNFKAFPYNNTARYSVGQASLSKNGNLLYFVSDKPGGEGKTDIWYCEKQADGSWGKPVNCGKTINTKEDESFPAINGDGNLYYSSNGLPGMGGFDIFKAKGEKSTWSSPVNLKYPLNSTSDDFYYITTDSLSGYFSSNREGGLGSDDIYSFSYKPLVAAVTVSKVVAAPKETIIAPKVVAVPKVVTVQPPSTVVAQSLPSVMKKGDTFILKNIYYDLNKFNIRSDAAVELDKLVAVLNEHPTMRLEIGSHTDSRASEAYNITLSNKRAASAVAYLVKQGIAPGRLVAKGYGDTRLLNQCEKGVKCTEAEHQINRRTEVHVLSE